MVKNILNNNKELLSSYLYCMNTFKENLINILFYNKLIDESEKEKEEQKSFNDYLKKRYRNNDISI